MPATPLQQQRRGDRFKRAREGSGLSQRQLARRLAQNHLKLAQGTEDYQRGVESLQRNLRRYEKGQNTPRGNLLVAIARELDTDPGALVDDDEEEAEPLAHLMRGIDILDDLKAALVAAADIAQRSEA